MKRIAAGTSANEKASARLATTNTREKTRLMSSSLRVFSSRWNLRSTLRVKSADDVSTNAAPLSMTEAMIQAIISPAKPEGSRSRTSAPKT